MLLPVLAAVALAVLGETRAFPWYQWSIGIIPALIGFVQVRSSRMAALSLLGSYSVLEVFRSSPDNAVIFAGSALAIIALSITTPATALSRWSARLSMWVYLNHMLVIFFVEANGATGVWLAVITFLISVSLAICIERVVQRLRPTPS